MSDNLPQIDIKDANTVTRESTPVERAMYIALVTAAVQASMNLSNLCTLIGKPDTATFVDENAAKPLAGLLVNIYAEKNAGYVDTDRQN